MGRVMIITSGKGGTGKTSLCAGLALALSELGQNVLCIDADIGLRNLDIALGMTDSVLMDFSDVMEGRCSLARAVAPHPGADRLHLLTAPLTLHAEAHTKDAFIALVAEARPLYDFVLIDSPAGLDLGFQLAAAAADEAIVVSMNDLSALRDAQRIITHLSPRSKQMRLVLNRVRPKHFRRLGQTVDDVMDSLGLGLLGLIPEDSEVLYAANIGRPLLGSANRGAARAMRNMARRLLGQAIPLMKI